MSIKQRTFPRRTEEFNLSAPQSSVKKPSSQRTSRMPIRKLSKLSIGQNADTAGRSVSTDRTLTVPGTAAQSGTMVGGRSKSVTPRRTPLRNLGTIPSQENQLAVLSTVEREKHTADAGKIFDYLAGIPVLPQEFIERRNLRTMSMKQFLVIMAHLFRQLGGNRYKIGNNFIEDIIRTMAELEYPYMLNKSMLKTPTAPHAINNTATMLAWLVQIVPQPHEPNDWSLTYGDVTEFPSETFTTEFFRQAQTGFSLWNQQKETEFGALVEGLTDQLVALKTNGLTRQEVLQKTEQMGKQLDTAKSPQGSPARKQSFDGMHRVVQEKQREIKLLTEENRKLSKQLAKLDEAYYDHQDEYYDWDNRILKLRQSIAEQKLTSAERDELIEGIVGKKNVLAVQRNSLAVLEQKSCELQVTVSRSIKQKLTLISELNTRLQQFADSLKPCINFEPPALDMKTVEYEQLLATLESIERQLAVVFAQQNDLYRKLSEEKTKLELQIVDQRIVHETQELVLEKTRNRHALVLQEREAITQQLSAISSETNIAKQEQQHEEKHMLQQLQEATAEVERSQAAVVKLRMDRQRLMVSSLENCQEIVQNRKERLEAVKQNVLACEQVANTLRQWCSKNLPVCPPIDRQ